MMIQLLHICRQTACNTGHFQQWERGRQMWPWTSDEFSSQNH